MATWNGFSIKNFVGGVNEGIDESLIPANTAARAQNCDILDGCLSTSKGATKYTTATLVNAGTLMAYYKDKVGMLLIAANGEIDKLDSDTLAKISTEPFTSNIFDYVNYKVSEDTIILTNGSEVPYVYNGTTLRKLKNRRKVYNTDGSLKGYNDGNEVFHATEADITTYAPKGKFIALQDERIWIADDNNVYFSTADRVGFDPEDWTTPTDEDEANMHGGFIETYSNDGSKNIGLHVIFNDILIFKEKTIFKIFGSAPSNYTKIQIFSSNGAIADKSIVSSYKGSFFINKDGIWQYDGTNVLPISDKIKATFENINKDYINNSCAVFYKNKYILAVPEGTSQANNLIIEYDVDNKTFMFRRGFEVASFCEFNNKLLFINTANKILSYDEGLTIDGTAIGMYWESGLTDLTVPNAYKEFEEVYFTGSGNGSVTLTLTTEKKSKAVTIALNGTEAIYRKRLSVRGRRFKARIENVSGSNIKLKDVYFVGELDYD